MKRTLALAGLTAAVLFTLPAAAQDADGWCVVLGGFSYEQLDQANALAEKARGKTFADAATYDTRDLPEMAWGELAVIADRKATQKDAKTVIAAAKKAKLEAFAKPCSPLGARIATKADLKPLPKLSATPLDFDKPPATTCIGWSASLKAAACVVGASTLQEGGENHLVLLGVSEPALPLFIHKSQADGGLDEAEPTPAPGAVPRIKAALKKGGFVVLDAGSRALPPRGQLHWARPRFSVRHVRKATTHHESGNSWPEADDTIEVRCGGAKAAFIAALEESSYAYEDAVRMEVIVVPGTPFAILTLSTTWGIEGDSGGSTRAALVNMETSELHGQ